MFLDILGWDTRIHTKGGSVKKPFVGCLSHTCGLIELPLYWLECQCNPILKNS